MSGYEEQELTAIDAALDANPDATSNEVFQATRPYDERAIASVAASRALAGGGGSQPSYATITIGSSGFTEGGYAQMLLSDDLRALGNGAISGTATLGVPAVKTAGQVVFVGNCKVDSDFAAAHAVTVYAALNACNADGSELVDLGLDANVAVDPVTGFPDWSTAVWDVFTQVGSDLSQADGIAPRVVTAAGGVFTTQLLFQIQWT